MNKKGSYIIGETAYNHEGDIKYLYKMIDDIAELKLNAIKFHLLLDVASYMQEEHPLISKIKDCVFSEGDWSKILEYSKEKELDVIALCDDVESLVMINRRSLDVDAVEIHAVCLNDIFILKEASNFKKTVILGIGGSSLDEIQYAVNFLKKNGKNDIFLMYGFQNYPTDYSEINLSKMLKLKELFELPIGYADHTAFDDENNEIISSMAAAIGINVLEKHYTPDPRVKRIDYQASVGKEQMKRIRKYMDLALTVRGHGGLKMSGAEQKYGIVGPMKKAIVAKRDIKQGEEFSTDNLCFKRTKQESTMKQMDFPKLLGLKAKRNIKEDEMVNFSKAEFKSGE